MFMCVIICLFWLVISLSGKQELTEYMATNEVRCTYTQLRTKIMNEQNQLQAKAKRRLQKISENQ